MALAGNFRVLSLTPGRMRLHLSGCNEDDAQRIESQLRRMDGVQSVQANPLTRNILVRFDHRSTEKNTLLEKLGEELRLYSAGEESAAFSPRAPRPSLLKVGVRGLLGHAIVDSLWFGAGFLGKTVGLPLMMLGPLHVLLDIGVWALAFQSGSRPPVISPAGRMPSESVADGAGGFNSEEKFRDGAKRSGSPQR